MENYFANVSFDYDNRLPDLNFIVRANNKEEAEVLIWKEVDCYKHLCTHNTEMTCDEITGDELIKRLTIN